MCPTTLGRRESKACAKTAADSAGAIPAQRLSWADQSDSDAEKTVSHGLDRGRRDGVQQSNRSVPTVAGRSRWSSVIHVTWLARVVRGGGGTVEPDQYLRRLHIPHT